MFSNIFCNSECTAVYAFDVETLGLRKWQRFSNYDLRDSFWWSMEQMGV